MISSGFRLIHLHARMAILAILLIASSLIAQTGPEAPPTVQFDSQSTMKMVSEDCDTVTLTVILSQSSNQTINVDFKTVAGNAQAGTDFEGKTGTLTFLPTETEKTITIKILDNTISELQESLSVQLTLPEGTTNVTLGASVAMISILDNDPDPVVSVGTTEKTVSENCGTVSVAVKLNSISDRDVTVHYSVLENSAKTPSDFTFTLEPIVIPAGTQDATITIDIADDSIYELQEDFSVSLMSAANATIDETKSSCKITVLDNDVAPAIELWIDSNNNGAVDQNDRPIRNDSTKPGAIIPANIGDGDFNYVPDFADFEYLTQSFTPITVKLIGDFEREQAVVTFQYSSSDPSGLTQDPDGVFLLPPDNGLLRVWKSPPIGASQRNKYPANINPNGEYVAPGDYSLAQLGFGQGNEIVLYVEGLRTSQLMADSVISAKLDPDGAGVLIPLEDKVCSTVLGIEFVQGKVDPSTGRGAVGQSSEILEKVGSFVNASQPKPQVTLQAVNITQVARNSTQQLVADITVAGKATFALSDILPDGVGDLTKAIVEIAGQEYPATTFIKRAESPSLLRPYACYFDFYATCSGVPITHARTGVYVKITEPIAGNVGWGFTNFEVSAKRVPFEDPNPIRDIDDPYRQVLKMKVDLKQFRTLADAAAAGADALGVDSKYGTEADANPLIETARLFLPPGEKPYITTAMNTNLTLVDVSQLGLAETEKGRFVAEVIVPEKGESGIMLMHFEETSPESNIFESQYVELSVSLPGAGLSVNDADSISVSMRKSTWSTTSDWQIVTAVEDGPDSKVFTVDGVTVKVADLSGADATVFDLISAELTSAQLGLIGIRINATETTANSSMFSTASEETYLIPWLGSYAEAWVNGPWETKLADQPSSGIVGVYTPMLLRLSGPSAALDTLVPGVSGAQVFGGDKFDVVKIDGEYFVGKVEAGGGDPKKAAVFVKMQGNLKDGDVYGGGRVSKAQGWIWGKLQPNIGDNKKFIAASPRVVSGGSRLFEGMIKVAKNRLPSRTGGDPGKIYEPKYKSGQPDDDPFITFRNYTWDNFLGKGGDLTVQENRVKVFSQMTLRDPKQKTFAGFGLLPGVANSFFTKAVDGNGEPGIPKLKLLGAKQGPMVGSKYLLGHWEEIGFDGGNDHLSQTQNRSQIFHVNNGMGWFGVGRSDKFSPPGPGEVGLEFRIRDLLVILTKDQFGYTENKRKKDIIVWMIDNGYADYFEQMLLFRGPGDPMPSEAEKKAAKAKANQFRGLKKGLTAIKAAKAFDSVFGTGATSKNDKSPTKALARSTFREMADAILVLNGFRPGVEFPNSLDLWIAYEVASGEGFQFLGIDSLNDIIATDAGRILGDQLLNGKIPNQAQFNQDFEGYFKSSREFLKKHQMFKGKRPVLESTMLSIMFAADPTKNGAPMEKVSIGPPAPPQAHGVLWNKTIGFTLASLMNNKDFKDRNFTNGMLDDKKFNKTIDDIVDHLDKIQNRGRAYPIWQAPGENVVYLDQATSHVFFDVIEVLMLIEDIPD